MGCSSVSWILLIEEINVLVFPETEIIFSWNDVPELTVFQETCANEDVTSVIVIFSGGLQFDAKIWTGKEKRIITEYYS